MQTAIARSWRAKDLPLHGRMDFSFTADGTPMLLDYEADSPFGLAEASYVQWEWFEAWQEASGAQADSQENLIYEKLSAHLPRAGLPPRFAIACGGETLVNGNPGDTGERFDAEYLAELARAAGLRPSICSMEQVGWDLDARCFTDAADEPLQLLLKIYPWDWMEDEPNVEALAECRTRILPGAWTRLVADKTMMALLWHMEPGAANLLPTFLERPAEPCLRRQAAARLGWRACLSARPDARRGAGERDGTAALPGALPAAGVRLERRGGACEPFRLDDRRRTGRHCLPRIARPGHRARGALRTAYPARLTQAKKGTHPACPPPRS